MRQQTGQRELDLQVEQVELGRTSDCEGLRVPSLLPYVKAKT